MSIEKKSLEELFSEARAEWSARTKKVVKGSSYGVEYASWEELCHILDVAEAKRRAEGKPFRFALHDAAGSGVIITQAEGLPYSRPAALWAAWEGEGGESRFSGPFLLSALVKAERRSRAAEVAARLRSLTPEELERLLESLR